MIKFYAMNVLLRSSRKCLSTKDDYLRVHAPSISEKCHQKPSWKSSYARQSSRSDKKNSNFRESRKVS